MIVSNKRPRPVKDVTSDVTYMTEPTGFDYLALALRVARFQMLYVGDE